MPRTASGPPRTSCFGLGQHYVDDFEWVSGGRWGARQVEWDRIPVNGEGHDHSFYRGGSGGETRTAVVKIDGDKQYVISGLEDLSVLKTTQSGFVGYPVDQYTTLKRDH